ncbi:membrane protein [soil metagenome]
MNQELVLDDHLQERKNLAWWLYFFHGLCLIFSAGLLSLVPLMVSYLKRPETAGTFVYSHHSWQIRTFWWYIVWLCVGGVLFVTIIGIPLAWMVWGVAWVWRVYCLIKGWVDLNQNRPMPA